MKVTHYNLTEQSVIAQIESGDMDCGIEIPRAEYEQWLSPDGTVDMSFTHHNGDVQTEVPCIVSIADYWLQGEEINDSPVCEHLCLYLTRTKAVTLEVEAKLLYEAAADILENLDDADLRLQVKSLILQYGTKQVERGMAKANEIYKEVYK